METAPNVYSGIPANSVSTRPATRYAGQKPGTSGLRKKTKEFMQQGYLSSFVQAVFNCLPKDSLRGSTLLVGGDGRYFCVEAIKKICSIAAGNGVGRVWVAKDGLASTPACSAMLRLREKGVAFGGFILTASHNPGGENEDFGIKFNTGDGAPAQENLMDAVYQATQTISEIKFLKLLDFDVDSLGPKVVVKGQFMVEVIDAVEDWISLMRGTFNFPAIKALIAHPQFSFLYDCMHGVAGPYAEKLFLEELGAKPDSLLNAEPLLDFGGGHPDPNLEYAKELVAKMKVREGAFNDEKVPWFGAAGDGDCDRNMILGRGFFVTPSDSVAVIASYAEACIPAFHQKNGGILGLARSMPTSRALDLAAEKMGKTIYETPTGWKFFTNLMNAGKISICGEESFGTGSTHIREKDGLWAVLSWLSILAFKAGLMSNTPEKYIDGAAAGLSFEESAKAAGVGAASAFCGGVKSAVLVSVKDVVEDFWKNHGRCYYMRYDFEKKDAKQAAEVMEGLTALTHLPEKDLHEKIGLIVAPELKAKVEIEKLDVFNYTDIIDGSTSLAQGVRMFAKDARAIWRLSGTGSSGATIRIYFEVTKKATEVFENLEDVLKDLIAVALQLCQLKKIIGTDIPTVIT